MGKFLYHDGGTVAQYYLASILDELGQNVRIYNSTGIFIQNPIFNKFYNNGNDFPIDDNTVVIYCEGTQGNPLNVKNAVRWMLSELGKNVPYHFVNTWGKDELVYYFNSETKFETYSSNFGNIYKLLTCVYINPDIRQTNFIQRDEYCHTFRKQHWHTNGIQYCHPDNSFEITRSHNQSQCIEFFNRYKYFISYDPCTFLTIIAALCGCISIVYPIHGLNKQQWIQTTAANEYVKSKGLDNLYGIAYGLDDLQYACDTIHLVKEQWDDIQKFCKEKTIVPFINDIQNFENMQNTLQNNYF